MISHHVGRDPTIVEICDGWKMVFFTDQIPNVGGTEAITYTSINYEYKWINASADRLFLESDRALLHTSINPNGKPYDIHLPVMYKTGATTSGTPAVIDVTPLVEANSMTVQYDKEFNTITFWWWSNFLLDVSEYSDATDTLYAPADNDVVPTTEVIRTLCSAVGSVERMEVDANNIDGDDLDDSGMYVVILEKPQICYKQALGGTGYGATNTALWDFVDAYPTLFKTVGDSYTDGSGNEVVDVKAVDSHNGSAIGTLFTVYVLDDS